MEIICPYCSKKTEGYLRVAELHQNNYSGENYIIDCDHCKKKIRICLQTVIKVSSIQKTSDKTELTFSEFQRD